MPVPVSAALLFCGIPLFAAAVGGAPHRLRRVGRRGGAAVFVPARTAQKTACERGRKSGDRQARFSDVYKRQALCPAVCSPLLQSPFPSKPFLFGIAKKKAAAFGPSHVFYHCIAVLSSIVPQHRHNCSAAIKRFIIKRPHPRGMHAAEGPVPENPLHLFFEFVRYGCALSLIHI